MESLHSKEEEMMISTNTQSPPTTWKLYHNPLYSHHPDPSLSDCTYISPPFPSHLSDLTFAMDTTTKSMKTELEEAKAQIIDLKSELNLERKFHKKMECLTKTLAKDLEEERRGREAAERVCDELGIQVSGHEAEVGRIKREIDEEEKKMMRVAEVFREGRVQMKLGDSKIANLGISEEQEKPLNKKLSCSYNESYGHGTAFVSPISVLRRAASPEPENPHIKRGIKGSVEFQRVVKAMCSNKSNKQLGGNYKLECQKAQLKILLKQRNRVRPDNLFIS